LWKARETSVAVLAPLVSHLGGSASDFGYGIAVDAQATLTSPDIPVQSTSALRTVLSKRPSVASKTPS
jgi:hypothetical protein